MTFNFRPAVRDRVGLLIAIAGASGTGKTFSALRLATGLAGDGGRIAFIDTEAGRAKHYADQFAFDHGDLTPPFSPARYLEAITAADKAGYDVIVIDSMSHEYEGDGGIIDMAESAAASGVKTPKNWIKPKGEHKRLVSRLLQCRSHLVFCLRAQEKMRIDKGDNGKPVIIAADDLPVEERWQPICEKRFMYEMATSLVLTPAAPGVPIPVKIQDQHRAFFPAGRPISEEMGRALAEWARGGSPSAPEIDADLVPKALSVANDGRAVFNGWFRGLEAHEKAALKAHQAEITAALDRADAEGGAP